MLKIKKLDSYLFKNFIGLFVLTFFICLFIIVMQFIWLRIDVLIGKGVPISILSKFFMYVALVSTPLALPLAILLASLMSFGNIGEKLELLAMKTAGISLFRIMRSLIVFIAIVSAGAFFFSNYVTPMASKKMWTLLFSFREKSLELEVPIGEFYSGINGINIYARDKDTEKKALLNVMIYNFSKGFENASITTADSVFISTTKDRQYLKISMSNGEYFENLKPEQSHSKSIPYRRESFKSKDLLIEFDSNFKEKDPSSLNNTYVAKNIGRLSHDVDSILQHIDSLRTKYSTAVDNRMFGSEESNIIVPEYRFAGEIYSGSEPINVDSIFAVSDQSTLEQIAKIVSQRAESSFSETSYSNLMISSAERFYVQHNMEWHRKFTLSFACLIFFFIGAPLGAIIGKGGIGLPAVISILFFIVYYIIDTFSQKMTNEGSVAVWQGMWTSSMILLPIGIFLTYKAAKDTQMLDYDFYKKFYFKIKTFCVTFVGRLKK